MNQETFGSYIRRLREKDKMPLRKLAAHLDIDQSTLSKIETNQRQPTKEMIPILSKIFKIDSKELKIKFLTERILTEIQDEKYGFDALQNAVQQITNSNHAKK